MYVSVIRKFFFFVEHNHTPHQVSERNSRASIDSEKRDGKILWGFISKASWMVYCMMMVSFRKIQGYTISLTFNIDSISSILFAFYILDIYIPVSYWDTVMWKVKNHKTKKLSIDFWINYKVSFSESEENWQSNFFSL